ncbi:deoxyguanosinetriphosphate triphosphohydrolase [Clostridia bacterium]|nr:deoxyguanosinetriphosphate triphosphohydrolase [Clostridia bacterium]
MLYRERWEEIEQQILSEKACLSKRSKGRDRAEEPCDIRTAFQRDRDRIVHAKSFRRLKHKTQVFISPGGDHFRTRLTHTLEVSQISRTIARGLRLNEDLVEAIALGHDLGHTPFGHAGESMLSELLPQGFKHNEQSLRIVEVLENNRKGLNLTQEVKDGILNHTGPGIPITLEGQIVKIADRIAYVNHDIDDALRANIISTKDIPKECLRILGNSHSERIDVMVRDMINTSEGLDKIQMGETVGGAMSELRDYLFSHVYVGSSAKTEDKKVRRLLTELFEYYMNNPHELPKEYLQVDDAISRKVADYISGMTDSYATQIYVSLFIPTGYPLKKS